MCILNCFGLHFDSGSVTLSGDVDENRENNSPVIHEDHPPSRTWG